MNADNDHCHASDPTKGLALSKKPCLDTRECKLCTLHFTLDVLPTHIDQTHKDANGQWLPCQYCHKHLSGRSQSSVERHLRDHRLPKNWICREQGCGHRVKHATDLRKHYQNAHKRFVDAKYCRDLNCYQPIPSLIGIGSPSSSSTSSAVDIPPSTSKEPELREDGVGDCAPEYYIGDHGLVDDHGGQVDNLDDAEDAGHDTALPSNAAAQAAIIGAATATNKEMTLR